MADLVAVKWIWLFLPQGRRCLSFKRVEFAHWAFQGPSGFALLPPLRAIAQDAFPSINDTFARVLADWHQTTQQFAVDSKLERVWIQQLLAWVSGSSRHAGRDCQVP